MSTFAPPDREPPLGPARRFARPSLGKSSSESFRRAYASNSANPELSFADIHQGRSTKFDTQDDRFPRAKVQKGGKRDA
jgi:hypothetical protein